MPGQDGGHGVTKCTGVFALKGLKEEENLLDEIADHLPNRPQYTNEDNIRVKRMQDYIETKFYQ